MREQVGQSEADRFWTSVVKGPGALDCWIWIGAIGGDGYGRFWTRRRGQVVVVPSHRYAFALVNGVACHELAAVDHVVCDNPICVRVDGGELDHLASGTATPPVGPRDLRPELRDGTPLRLRDDRPASAKLAARSRALRAAVKLGWDAAAIKRAIAPWPFIESGGLPLNPTDHHDRGQS